MTPRNRPVLVLGASGYVGARLVQRLLAQGYRVRAAARTERTLRLRPFAALPGVELVIADARDRASIEAVCEGCGAAYHLVHSMGPGTGDFEAADREAAANLAAAAERAGMQRVVYLGGLGEDETGLSPHLRSRAEVGEILRRGSVPLTWLRAAMVLGAGSGSFEILRYLVERLPVMIAPPWLDTECQPIAIGNVLDYLVGVLDAPEAAGQVLDIGGPEVTTYRRLMRICGEERRLPRRLLLTLPFLTPRLSSWWIDLVTPVPASLARPLAEGLRNRVVCRDDRIRAIVPAELLDCRQSIHAAFEGTPVAPDDCGLLGTEARPWPGDPAWSGGTTFVSRYSVTVDAPPEAAWRPIERIGGDAGWYFADPLWRLWGNLDRLVGGTGKRRGRNHPDTLAQGDPVDFWRVEALEPGRRLRLRAGVLMPGDATIEFSVTGVGRGPSEIRFEARFAPRGLLGILYWRAVDPLHHFVFPGLLREIARRSGGTILRGPLPGAGS